jgi:adenylate kinase
MPACSVRLFALIVGVLSTGVHLLGQSPLAPPMVFVIIGPPGSGKSTQSRLLGKKYRIPPIEIAELAKAELGKRSSLSEALKVSLASGDLINDDAANDLIKTRLLQADVARGFILDGYPRTAGQAEFLDRVLEDNGLPKPKVILLESPDEVVIKRMMKRRRADDKPEIVRQRLREYREDSRFLTEWYHTANVMLVDAAPSIQQVAVQIDALIADALEKKPFSTRQ